MDFGFDVSFSHFFFSFSKVQVEDKIETSFFPIYVCERPSEERVHIFIATSEQYKRVNVFVSNNAILVTMKN